MVRTAADWGAARAAELGLGPPGQLLLGWCGQVSFAGRVLESDRYAGVLARPDFAADLARTTGLAVCASPTTPAWPPWPACRTAGRPRGGQHVAYLTLGSGVGFVHLGPAAAAAPTPAAPARPPGRPGGRRPTAGAAGSSHRAGPRGGGSRPASGGQAPARPLRVAPPWVVLQVSPSGACAALMVALGLLLPWLGRGLAGGLDSALRGPQGRRLALALVLQDGVLALALTSLLAWAAVPGRHGLARLLVAGLTVLKLGTELADALLLRSTGLRLQWQFRTYLTELDLLAPRPWRRRLGLALVLALVAIGALAQALGASAAGASLGGLGPLARSGLLLSLLPLGWLAQAAMRRLPVALQARWRQPGLAWRGPRPAALPVSPTAAVPWPAAAEVQTPLDPNYPLLRRTQAFLGAPRFALDRRENPRPHVVVLFMESFRGADVGALGGPHGVSPQFDALAAEGLLWTRCHTHSGSTPRAALASLYGVLPRCHERPTMPEARPPRLLGLPHLFAARGYGTALFHNGPLFFDAKESFYGGRGFAALYGDQAIRARYPEADGTAWGPFDAHLMRFHLDWLAQQHRAGTPTFSALFTMTHHHPWEVPADAPPLHCAGVADADPYAAFLRSFRYADRCLGDYVRGLRAAQLDRDLVLVVLADTGQQQDHAGGSLHAGGVLQAPVLHVPLLLWAPGRLGPPQRFDELCGQIDIMPTLMDAFGMEGPHHGMGHSLMRAPVPRPLHLAQPLAPRHWGLMHDGWRFNDFPDDGACALHDLRQDPLGQVDLAPQHPERVQRCRAEVRATQIWLEALYRDDRFTPSMDLDGQGAANLDPNGLLPASLAAAAARLQALAALPDPSALQKQIARVLRLHLALDLPEPARLQLLRLRLKRLHQAELGRFSQAEADALAALEAEAEAQGLAAAAETMAQAQAMFKPEEP